MEGEDRVASIQELLDAGLSRNKVASVLGIHHKSVGRLFVKYGLEIYTAFDEEEDKKHIYQNFEWLYEEDLLEDMFFGVLHDDVLLPEVNERDADWLRISKYVRDNYKDIVNYAKVKKQGEALGSILIKCTMCGKAKDLNEYFLKRNGGFMGLDGRCRGCCAKKSIKWYYANPDKAKMYTKNGLCVIKIKLTLI
jgi:hypothetical protein